MTPEQISRILGHHGVLPTPQDLTDRMAAAEVGLLAGAGEIGDQILEAGWYLHGVASAWGAPDAYPIDRRRAAFQLAAHIFDLALRSETLGDTERLRLTFAAQVGYLQSDSDPGAIAIYRRLVSTGDATPFLDTASPALTAGTALLALDTSYLFHQLRGLRDDLEQLQQQWAVDLDRTPYAAAAAALDGIWYVHLYLLTGVRTHLEGAQRALRLAVETTVGAGDIDSRWVAAHLLNLLPDIEATSLWGALPPTVPSGARRAFAMAAPPVLRLWPPQIGAMRDANGRSPADPDVRRVVMSLPTSAGKTLFAQILVGTHIATKPTGACFVAPTRSLCREVERSLRSRLRFMARASIVSGEDDLFVVGVGEPVADVAVVTPERLAYLLRQDPQSVLDRYGLFVFDEVHSVADGARGWLTESLVSYVHAATAQTDHKIVLMSAAIGNRVHFVQWVDPTSEGIAFHSDWRATRRLTAIYTTEAPDFGQAVLLPRPTSRSPERRSRPLTGVLRVRTNDGQQATLSVQEPVGTLVTKQTPSGWARDSTSTPFYQCLAPIVDALAD